MSILRPVAVAAALAALSVAPAAAETPARYSVEVSVVRDGVEVMQARTLIAERSRAGATLTDGDQTYEFTAALAPEPGQPLLGRLRMQGQLTVDGRKVAAPIITFARHAEATMSTRDGPSEIFVRVTPLLERAINRSRRP